MKTRSVRLDQETEELLNRILEKTDLNISEIFKEGIRTLAQSIDEKDTASPYSVFKTLELGPGGDSQVASIQAKQAIKEILVRKHR